MTENEILVKINTIRAQIRYGEMTDDFFYTCGKGYKLKEELRKLSALLREKVEG